MKRLIAATLAVLMVFLLGAGTQARERLEPGCHRVYITPPGAPPIEVTVCP